jgi:O-antigen/teichoic acid export membrane protein
MKQSMVICISGSVSLAVACWLANQHHLRFAHRVLSPLPFTLLLMSVPLNVLVFAQAYYLRAHKQERFLVNSVVGAASVVLSSYLLGRLYGAMGMVTGYLLINLAGIGWATAVFRKYRGMWHGQWISQA